MSWRQLTDNEKALLENLLDSLDRLFDREARVVDVYAILFATAKAMDGTEFGQPVERFVGKLDAIVRSPCTEDQRRDEALVATDDLRHFLAEVLPFP